VVEDDEIEKQTEDLAVFLAVFPARA